MVRGRTEAGGATLGDQLLDRLANGGRRPAPGTLGELRHELATGEHAAHHTSMRDWLDAGRAERAS